MSEPASSTVAAVPLITLAVALFGASYGPYIVITLGAIGGSFWAIIGANTKTRTESMFLAMRSIMTALVLTAFISGVIGPWLGVDTTEIYVVVSFVIAALGDKWLDILDTIKTKIQTAITSKS
jgi:hypothetical protein